MPVPQIQVFPDNEKPFPQPEQTSEKEQEMQFEILQLVQIPEINTYDTGHWHELFTKISPVLQI